VEKGRNKERKKTKGRNREKKKKERKRQRKHEKDREEENKEDKTNLEATIKKLIVDRTQTQTLEDPMVGPLDLIEIITITVKEVVEVVGTTVKEKRKFIKRLEIIILMLKWKIC